MIYVFDIDGTVCTNTNGNYDTALPLKSRIDKVNQLFDSGHTIIMMTARGMNSSDNDQTLADAKMRAVTELQLKDWGIKYHDLYFGKPYADFYIDDKAVNDKDFFNDQRRTFTKP